MKMQIYSPFLLAIGVSVCNGQTVQQQAGGLTKKWLEEVPDDNALQNKDQASALVTLYYATGGENGDSWETDTNWLAYNVSECSWYNQADKDACNEAGQLQEIILKNNGLSGKFRGSIFETLGEHAVVRELDFDGNSITGTLPTEIALVTTLEELNLRSNSVGGKIPTHLGLLSSSLESLYFDENQLTGTLPKQLDQLTLLEQFEFSNNRLVGSIPSTYGDAFVNLVYFELFFNERLNGTLPANLFSLPNLQYFSIEFNYFTGTIPTTIGSSSTLAIFNLKDNYLVGPIPSQLGLLSNTLEEIRLDDNRLEGTIPTTLGQLANIKEIQLDQNDDLTGPIPTQLGNCALLEELVLSQTSITGTVPTELESLKFLTTLDLTETDLVGEIPAGLCNLPELSFTCEPKMDGFLCGCGSCDCNAPVPVPVPDVVLSAQEEPEPQPEPAPEPQPQQDDGGGGLSICFSEDMTVLVEGRTEPTKMKDLQIGDAILTSTGDFSTVYAFGHNNPTRPVEFIKIWLDNDTNDMDPSCPAEARRNLPILRNVRDTPLEISADHLIYTNNKKDPVRADSLREGDTLQTIEGPRTILQLELIRKIGIYAPLTQQGTLVVNGIMASSYVSLEKQSSHVTTKSPLLQQLSYHDLFHMTAAPLRLFCNLSAMIPHEFLALVLPLDGNNADGMPHYVAFGLDVLLWVSKQHWIVQYVVMTIILFVTGLIYSIEMALSIKPIFLACVALIMHNLLSRKDKNNTKKQQQCVSK